MIFRLTACALLLSLSSCAIQEAATPLEASGFVDRKEEGVISERTPFQYAYWNGVLSEITPSSFLSTKPEASSGVAASWIAQELKLRRRAQAVSRKIIDIFSSKCP